MKISLNWLTDYVDVSMPARQLGDLLTSIGLCCEDIIEAGDDIVLDLEVTSNRSDCLGHIGVAREVASATGAELRPPVVGELAMGGKVEDLTTVEVLDPDLCPRYTARVLRGVKVGPSPAWLVERLEAVGVRSINNVVDVTNYVLMEYSQPLHSFDYDKLAENRIVVRRAGNGETLVSIDETMCELDDSMLIIADASRPVAIAGVMGGLKTEVTQSTTNVLLESAQFDPLSIRRTSRKLAMMSESNYRFERGVDPVGVDRASLRACGLILELAGGTLARGVVDVWDQPYQPPRVRLRPQRCTALLGVQVPADRQVEILAGLGLGPRIEDETIVCEIPSHRADLRREVDLIEEVARLAGYETIPVADKISHPVLPEGAVQRTRRRVSEIMTAAGFDEAMTFALVDSRELALFGCDEAVCVDPLTRKTNNALRTTLVPSLLRACKTNQDVGNASVSLWELAAVFGPGGAGEMPEEHVEAALVTTGDLAGLRGVVELLISRIAPRARLEIEPAGACGLMPGASAQLRMDGRRVGTVGYVSREILDYYALERAIAAAVIDFGALMDQAQHRVTYQPVPKFPAARRDLSLIVDDALTWRELTDAIGRVDQPARVGVEYVTTFRGKPIPPGRKSVTVTLVYRWDEGTLRRQQVDQQVADVLEAMMKEFRAEVRT